MEHDLQDIEGSSEKVDEMLQKKMKKMEMEFNFM